MKGIEKIEIINNISNIRKINEDFIQHFVINFAHILIIVVGKLNCQTQKFLYCTKEICGGNKN